MERSAELAEKVVLMVKQGDMPIIEASSRVAVMIDNLLSRQIAADANICINQNCGAMCKVGNVLADKILNQLIGE
jgi:hypothetical protein